MASKTEAQVAEETPVEETPETKPVKTDEQKKQERDERARAKSLERFPALDAERMAWVEANARPAISPCLCGCGELTKSRFAPGHDATLKEQLKNTVAAGGESGELAQSAIQKFGW